MTWIVAKSFTTGYVGIFSDVQVSWKGRKERRDCLRKVYPVADNIVASFSGSVDVGFLLLSDLGNFIEAKKNSGDSVIPRVVAIKWRALLR